MRVHGWLQQPKRSLLVLRRLSLALTFVLLCTAFAIAQPMMGNAEGTVHLSNGLPAAGAWVSLDGLDGGPHHPPFHGGIPTEPNGHFSFHQIPTGGYSISAWLPLEGWARDVIEVHANQTTHITLTLEQSDTLAVLDLEGTAIVVGPDQMHPVPEYFLDTNGDGFGEFHLSFGPAWYQPPGEAHRPHNGDQITIHGGLFTYGMPPIIIVYQINGQFWRPEFDGHGGYGGDHGDDCDPDSVIRVELGGRAIVNTTQGWHGEAHAYFLETNFSAPADYRLDFGADNYNPGNGASRPANNDSVVIVGGRIFCPGEPIPIVVVYEINGLFWRQPGDTTGMGPMHPDEAAQPVAVGAPLSYLTARNFPNPFNPVTTISYSIPIAGHVRLSVFDVTGREMTELVNGLQTAGSYSIAWDGRDFASGIYFYRVTVGNLSFTGRMVLMK
jgi:hypothetical protein